ncbi:MAG: family 43 glycosylhydrolase [Halanaerobium sp.]
MGKKNLYLTVLLAGVILIMTAAAISAAEPDAYYSFDGHLEDEAANFGAGKLIEDNLGDTAGVVGEDIFLEQDSDFKDGIENEALYFDGEKGVLLPENLIESDQYTVSLWLKPENKNQHSPSFFGAAEGDKWLSVLPGGNDAFKDETMVWSGTNWYDASTGLKIATEHWYNLTFTVDQDDIEIFINGQSRYQGDDFPDIFSDADSVFSLAVNWWDTPYQGLMDELKIYNEVLEEAEIKDLAAGAPELVEEEADAEEMVYRPQSDGSVSVHDPMIIKDDGSYYLFGSHLAQAKSDDLIDWEQLASGFNADNPVIKGNPAEELKEAMEWPEPENAESTWAKSPVKIGDKYYLYFSTSTWGATRSAIGLATSDTVEGPYEYQGLVLKSYNEGKTNIEGEPHNPRQDPNAIDPHVFYDQKGKLWMSYGSYSGGIYILEMDPETGMPLEEESYGKKVAGGDHSAMEGSYVLYHPESDYYYFMVSFGTLAADGGYNIRVARSENPNGPFIDQDGDNMVDARPRVGKDHSDFGARLIGNFWFEKSEIGYLSPGHNSALYDKELDKSFVLMHSRFPGQGERHNVRVHQILINDQGWPLIMPHRYMGETQAEDYNQSEIAGDYQLINHGSSVNDSVNQSEEIRLSQSGEISGAVEGSWEQKNGNSILLTIDGTEYLGELLVQYDEGLKKDVMTFSALSDKGISIWGSQY